MLQSLRNVPAHPARPRRADRVGGAPRGRAPGRCATAHGAARGCEAPSDGAAVSDIAPRAALARYALSHARLEPITVGLINQTWRVEAEDGQRWVLQRVNPIFTAAVNQDIEAITALLANHHVLTPRLVPTQAGELCAPQEDGVYRLLTFIDGEVVSTLGDPARAAGVARLVARFHLALKASSTASPSTARPTHDTPKHLAFLKTTLADFGEHPASPTCSPSRWPSSSTAQPSPYSARCPPASSTATSGDQRDVRARQPRSGRPAGPRHDGVRHARRRDGRRAALVVQPAR